MKTPPAPRPLLTILGVDPGGRETGFACVRGQELLGGSVYSGPKMDPRSAVALRDLEEVLETLARYARDYAVELVAVETVRAPNPHLGITNAAGAIGAASVAGAVIAWARAEGLRYVLVDPAEHSPKVLAAYPVALRPTRGQGKGTDVLRHARSAYDLALVVAGRARIASVAGA